MKRTAQARKIDGVEYANSVAFIAAHGFSADEAQAVIAAYKAHFAKPSGSRGSWIKHVTQTTIVKDEVRATAIMRLHRKFYGK